MTDFEKHPEELLRQRGLLGDDESLPTHARWIGINTENGPIYYDDIENNSTTRYNAWPRGEVVRTVTTDFRLTTRTEQFQNRAERRRNKRDRK